MSKGAGGRDFWVLRLDSAGSLIWDKTFGGVDDDLANSIVALGNGDLAVVGETFSKGEGSADFWVIRIDAQGTMLWDATFGGSDLDIPENVVELPGGDFVVTGWTTSNSQSEVDLWVLRLDQRGKLVWERKFASKSWQFGNAAAALANGGLVVAGYTGLGGAGGDEVWLIRFDSAGAPVWERTFGGGKDDGANAVVILDDGGLAVAGFSESTGAGGKDFWVLRIAGAEEPTVVGAR